MTHSVLFHGLCCNILPFDLKLKLNLLFAFILIVFEKTKPDLVIKSLTSSTLKIEIHNVAWYIVNRAFAYFSNLKRKFRRTRIFVRVFFVRFSLSIPETFFQKITILYSPALLSRSPKINDLSLNVVVHPL